MAIGWWAMVADEHSRPDRPFPLAAARPRRDRGGGARGPFRNERGLEGAHIAPPIAPASFAAGWLHGRSFDPGRPRKPWRLCLKQRGDVRWKAGPVRLNLGGATVRASRWAAAGRAQEEADRCRARAQNRPPRRPRVGEAGGGGGDARIRYNRRSMVQRSRLRCDLRDRQPACHRRRG